MKKPLQALTSLWGFYLGRRGRRKSTKSLPLCPFLNINVAESFWRWLGDFATDAPPSVAQQGAVLVRLRTHRRH